jgi:hypothetical protein
MAEIDLGTTGVVVAVLLAVFVAAVNVYQVRVRREPVDSAAIRFVGLLLGISLFALCITVFDLGVAGDKDWIQRLLLGFGVLFAWLVRPRK